MKMLAGPSLSLMHAYGTGDFYMRQMEKKGSVAGALAAIAVQRDLADSQRSMQVSSAEAQRMNEMLLEEEHRRRERMQAGFSGRMGMLSPDGDIAAGMRTQMLMARAQQEAFEHAAKESAVQTGVKMAHLVKEALLPLGAVKALLPGATKTIARAAPRAIASVAPAAERAGARAAVSGVRGALGEPGLAGVAARATKVRAEKVLSNPIGLAHAPSPKAVQQGVASSARVPSVKPALGGKPPSAAADPFEGVHIPAETPSAGAAPTPGLAPASATRIVRTPVPAGSIKGKPLRPFSSPAKAAPDAASAHPGLAKAPETAAPAAEATPVTQRSAAPASAPPAQPSATPGLASPPASTPASATPVTQPSATPGLASPAPAAQASPTPGLQGPATAPPVAGMEPGQVLPNGLSMPAPQAPTGSAFSSNASHLGLASPTVTQPGGGMAGLNFHVQGPSGMPGLQSPAAIQTAQAARQQMAELANPAVVNKAVGEGPLPGMAPTAMKPQQAIETAHGAVPVEQAMQNTVAAGKTPEFKRGLRQEAKTQRWEDQMLARADKAQHPGLASPQGAQASGAQAAGAPAVAPEAEAASKPWNSFSAGNIAKGIGLAGLGLGAYGAYKGLGAGQDYMMQPTYASNTYGGVGALPYGPQY